MTNLKIETTETYTMNLALSKDKFVQAIKDFKEFNLDIANKPHKDEYGFKEEGSLRFSTYIFYAMLKGMKVNKTTHSVKSNNYLLRLNALKVYSEGYYNGCYHIGEELQLIDKCFKSLSIEDIKKVISFYLANNK
jgi:hypothetical protein